MRPVRNVFLVHENVHVTSQAAALVTEVEAKAGSDAVQRSHNLGDRRAIDRKLFPSEVGEELVEVPRELHRRHSVAKLAAKPLRVQPVNQR